MNPNNRHYHIAYAWINGATIEFLDKKCGEWKVIENPSFDEDVEYRLKPKVAWYENIADSGVLCWVSNSNRDPNSENVLALIKTYDKNVDYKFSSKAYKWQYAQPLTFIEIATLLRTAEKINETL